MGGFSHCKLLLIVKIVLFSILRCKLMVVVRLALLHLLQLLLQVMLHHAIINLVILVQDEALHSPFDDLFVNYLRVLKRWEQALDLQALDLIHLL